MGLRFSAWNLLLSLLFLCAQVLSENLHDSHSIPSHMNHMDPSTMVFFTLKNLKIGETMPIYFRKRDPSAYPQALPREEADSIPFSLKQLPYLLQFFSFSDDSPLAKAMEGTLNHCEVPPIEGETKICATSLESMLDFVHGTFGLETKFRPKTENKLFGVSLGGDNGDRVEAVAVCHMDTSHWSRDHASFRVLGIEPGSSHVCHFFQADNIVYIPAPTYHD
ncbi:hypothetical protein WN944_029016 [Citrus x changshan-huyou]|uniref:BURP domain-containing protein n=1 Tax=Citrus x changshan-huyou TaxID=2935761 RepID=A0AAP0LN33_9ROSI